MGDQPGSGPKNPFSSNRLDWNNQVEGTSGEEPHGRPDPGGAPNRLAGLSGGPARRTVTFRCAKTNAHFVVAFERRSTNGKFAVAEIGASSAGPTTEQCRLLNSSPFEAAEFDFTGWYCPVCMHGRSAEPLDAFVQCSRCGELVCGARIHLSAGGEKMFRCRDACGNESTVAGVIKSLAGTSVERAKCGLAAPQSKGVMMPEQPIPPSQRGARGGLTL